MNTVKSIEMTTPAIGTVGIVERAIRIVISIAGFLAILLGLATDPLQYFILSVLGIYLVHTAFTGLDPFYAAVHYVRLSLKNRRGNPSTPVQRLQ